MTFVFSPLAGTVPEDASLGGLSMCFACDPGWNWHVLLSTIAVAVTMTEANYAFAPVFRYLQCGEFLSLRLSLAVQLGTWDMLSGSLLR